MKHLLLSLGLLSYPIIANTQVLYETMDSVNINNINARALVHGDLWYNNSDHVGCEFPSGSGKCIGTAAGIWFSAYENDTTLHISTSLFRSDGVDYWPGPLDNSGNTDTNSIKKWAKIWKVNKTDIESFVASQVHTTGNTPLNILQWPAKGNVYAQGNNGIALSITEDMAPFIDLNKNGVYEPLSGEYPAIKGDQMLWWVINDNGPTPRSSKGTPLKIQVQIAAYAYSTGGLINNVVYYEYNFKNRSQINYTKVRFGQFADLDVGGCFDDHSGYDKTRRLGFVYNGASSDYDGADYTYGSLPPIVGMTLIQAPGDNANNYPTGSYMVFKNTSDTIDGDPKTQTDYNNYMHSTWKKTGHLKNDFQGAGIPSSGHSNIGDDVDCIFTGDPSVSTEWSECASNNRIGDRRIIISTEDFTLNAGENKKALTALVVTNTGSSNTCPNIDMTELRAVCDTAWANSTRPLEIMNIEQGPVIKLYPNPAGSTVHLSSSSVIDIDKIRVIDVLGRRLSLPVSGTAGDLAIDIQQLPSGIYSLEYVFEKSTYAKPFVKQ